MTRLLICTRYLVLCVGLGFLLVPAASSQQPDGRLEGVFKDWKNRQERIKSIRYVVRGEKVVPKGSVLDPSTFKPVTPEKPDRDLSCKLHWTLLLDLAAQRHRLEVDEQYYNNLDDKIHSRAFTRTYDGTVVKGYRPREKNTGTGIAANRQRIAKF